MDSPFHDVYKFLLFCALDCHENNNMAVYALCVELFTFFNTEESLNEVLESQWDSKYALPKLETPMEDYIDFVINVFNTQGLNVVKYSSDQHVVQSNFSETSSMINVTGELPVAINFLDLYDFYHHFSKREFELIKESFNYEKAKDNFVVDIKEKIDRMVNVRIDNVNLTGQYILDPTVIDTIKRNNALIYEKSELLEEISNGVNIGSFAAYHFYDDKLLDWLINIANQVLTQELRLCENVDRAYNNYENYIRPVTRDMDHEQKIKDT